MVLKTHSYDHICVSADHSHLPHSLTTDDLCVPSGVSSLSHSLTEVVKERLPPLSHKSLPTSRKVSSLLSVVVIQSCCVHVRVSFGVLCCPMHVFGCVWRRGAFSFLFFRGPLVSCFFFFFGFFCACECVSPVQRRKCRSTRPVSSSKRSAALSCWFLFTMSSVAHLKDKYSSPFYKKQAAFLTAFTKSLTSSKPSTIARRRKDLSVTKPGKYLKLAHPKKEPPLPPKPPYVPQRLQQLIRAQDEHGRWKPTRDVLEALGGYVPDPPDGMEPTRWVSALVLVFFKRHPEYWFATDKAYDAGEQYVGDDRLLRTAAQALPPGFADRPGSYNARLDREAVLQGRWKESEQALLKTVGYMGFVPDAGAGAGGSSSSSSLSGAELSGGIGDVFSDFSKANASPRSNEEFSAYTEIAATIAKHHDRRRSMPARFSEAAADTGMDMSERRSEGGETSSNSGRSPATTSSVALNATTSRSEAIAESSSRPRTPTKNILRPRIQLKQGTPMDADTRKFLKKIAPITKYHSSVYEEELQQAAKRRPFYHVGEFVQVRWRRPSRWELPRETITWYPAVVVRMKANGRAVGVQFKDGDCETDLNVPVEHVRNGIQRDFTSLALLQREWEKPVRAGTERARVARRYVQPTQPKWKSCVNIAANSHGDPEASYAQVGAK